MGYIVTKTKGVHGITEAYGWGLIGNICTFLSLLALDLHTVAIDTHLQAVGAVITTRYTYNPLFTATFSLIRPYFGRRLGLN
jgi:hypothetical protein